MKTFKQFLFENEQTQEKPNSRGILFHNDKIFVGVNHGVTPQLSPDIQKIVRSHAEQHGHWDEGNGGDAEVTKPLVKKQSKGSWDEDLINRDLYTDKKRKRFTPHYHLTNIFGNKPGSEQEKNLAHSMSDNNLSVKDAIIKNQNKLFPHAPVKNPEDFFENLGKDYHEAIHARATPDNIHNFIKRGAADTWHGNDNPDTPLGRMARQVQTDRENHLIDKAPPGVYFIGSGHIPSMQKRLQDSGQSYRLVGGSKAHL
jgi:hypothetical protein